MYHIILRHTNTHRQTHIDTNRQRGSTSTKRKAQVGRKGKGEINRREENGNDNKRKMELEERKGKKII